MMNVWRLIPKHSFWITTNNQPLTSQDLFQSITSLKKSKKLELVLFFLMELYYDSKIYNDNNNIKYSLWNAGHCSKGFILINVILTANLEGRYHYSHFPDEAEPQINKSLAQIHVGNKQEGEIQTWVETLQSPGSQPVNNTVSQYQCGWLHAWARRWYLPTLSVIYKYFRHSQWLIRILKYTKNITCYILPSKSWCCYSFGWL